MSWTKFIVGFDLHGDRQHEKSVDVFHKFTNIWKPKIRVMGGDLFDFRPLRKKANEDERRESMAQDFEAGMEFLETFSPTHYLRGNHCERLWELALRDKGVESDYALQGIEEITARLNLMKCKLFPYHKRTGVLKIGHLKILHGFHTGVFAARQHGLIYGACLFGHAHTIDESAVPGLERRVARCCGCLCELDMEYNARITSSLRHAHGFAYGLVNEKTGDYHVFQAEEVNEQWIIPSDIITLK